jgi:IS30 family transposase
VALVEAVNSTKAKETKEQKPTAKLVDERFYSVRDVARLTRQSVSTIRRQLRREKVPVFQFSRPPGANGALRYAAADIEKFLLGGCRRPLPGHR